MSRILIQNATVLTLDESNPVVHDASIAIEGSTIRSVGGLPAGFIPDETLDATGCLVLPGLFDAHTHSGSILYRGAAATGTPAMCFDTARVTYDATAADSSDEAAEDAYWGASLALVEMIRGGTVGFGDHYFWMDRIAEVVERSGLRACLTWCTFGRDEGEIGGDLTRVAAFTQAWNGAAGGRILTALGPHSSGACSPRFLARTAAVAARLGVGVHIHLSETRDQVAASADEYGMNPVELAAKNGLFDVPVTAVHAAELSLDDIDLLSEREACVVYCPSAQFTMGLGRTPVEILQAAGVPVGLGTGGNTRSFASNMVGAARDAILLGHGIEASITPADALRMATRVSAAVLGFQSSGRISPGSSADLALVDAGKPHLAPLHDPLLAVFHGVRAGDVTDVMVGGQWLMRNGMLTTLDEERILWEVRNRTSSP